jgi:hypothetical protein
MTKDEAKYIAAGLNYLMQQIRAKETPCDHDSEGNVVAHTTSLITEVMEIEIEKIHAFIERASETDEEREGRELREEMDADYYRGLGV